jgi:hypothetical protein
MHTSSQKVDECVSRYRADHAHVTAVPADDRRRLEAFLHGCAGRGPGDPTHPIIHVIDGTGAKAEAWCLLIHAEASLSLSRDQRHLDPRVHH